MPESIFTCSNQVFLINSIDIKLTSVKIVDMLIEDKIYISNKEVLTLPPYLLDQLTYTNPDYFTKQNLGISTRGVPKHIVTYNLEDGGIQIARGEAIKIRPWIRHLPYEFNHPDHPIKLQYINNEFPLDEFQERAVKAMVTTPQGIIHAVTSAGKSVILLKAIIEIEQKALIVVNRKVLMQQLLEDIDKYIRDEEGSKIIPGIIGNGRKSVGPITVAIDRSLSKNLHAYEREFGILILDECHLVAAQTIYEITGSLNTKYRFGLSGTLKRKDKKDFLIYASFGQVIAKIGKEELEAKGRVVPVQTIIVETETRFDWDGAVEYFANHEKGDPVLKARALQAKTIMLDPNRNNLILELVKNLPGKTIVLSRFVEPCYKLQNELKTTYGIEAGVITGKDSKEALASYEDMKHGDLMVIFATIGCVSTGVSISDLDNIVLISPLYTNELLLHQIRGRLMRSSKGKTHGTLYFMYDQYIFDQEKLKKFLRIMEI